MDNRVFYYIAESVSLRFGGTFSFRLTSNFMLGAGFDF